MIETIINKDQIREAIFELVRSNKHKLSTNFLELSRKLHQHFVKQHFALSKDPDYLIGPEHEVFMEVVWQLVSEGIIFLDHNQNFQLWLLKISDYGEKISKEPNFNPHDPLNFTINFKTIYSSPRPITLNYLEETLKAFQRNLFLSSAVMVGVVAESILNDLSDAVSNSYSVAKDKTSFDNDVKNKTVTRIYEELSKRINRIRSKYPTEPVLNELDTNWRGIGDIIRLTRNDAGHPTGRTLDKLQAFSLFPLLAQYARKVNELIVWLTSGKKL